MKFRTLLLAALVSLLGIAQSPAQTGPWRAASANAKSITGDVSFTDTKVFLNFSGFTIAEIRSLKPDEARVLFDLDNPSGAGNLYRLDIPGDKRFLHHNTLCGSDDAQWLAAWVEGRNLQIAFFSGSTTPALTPDAVLNGTNICGVFTYTR
jgi:hypothetical protein